MSAQHADTHPPLTPTAAAGLPPLSPHLIRRARVCVCVCVCLAVCVCAQRFTQVTLIALLWGPNSGGLSLIGDVADVMLDCLASCGSNQAAAAAANTPALGMARRRQRRHAALRSLLQPGSSIVNAGAASRSNAPTSWQWLANGDAVMVLVTLCVVLPLSCRRHMRSLDSAAAAGMVIICALCVVLAWRAVGAGMPAIVDGQFPLWSMRVCGGSGVEGGGWEAGKRNKEGKREVVHTHTPFLHDHQRERGTIEPATTPPATPWHKCHAPVMTLV